MKKAPTTPSDRCDACRKNHQQAARAMPASTLSGLSVARAAVGVSSIGLMVQWNQEKPVGLKVR
jgi:hypothetical protein